MMLYRFLSSGLRVVVVYKTVLSCDKRPMYFFKEICLTEILSHCVITEPGNEHTFMGNIIQERLSLQLPFGATCHSHCRASL